MFILTDDLSWDLVRHMPSVQRMRREGMTFRQFIVADPLCCPSRAAIFTGRLPHNSGVLRNVEPTGGYYAFVRTGAVRRSFNVALERAGYRTSLIGDRHAFAAGDPPGYRALRTRNITWVQYVGTAQRELYDRRHDPWERHNVAYLLSRAERTRLDAIVRRLAVCHGASCRTADRG